MIEAVVFDCDGVLVDSERVNNEVLAGLVTCTGLPTAAEDSAARYMACQLWYALSATRLPQ
jgi:beta-phosphoglucomutase-like phosphatase (HAD superfamily)